MFSILYLCYIAKEYFGFLEDEKLKSVIADAYQYVLDYQVQP